MVKDLALNPTEISSARDPQLHGTTSPERVLGSPRNTIIVLVPIALVLITFLFWYQTWFGRPLSDREMNEYLADTSAPHKTQHALAQLSDRIARGDSTTHRWYPQLLAMARNKEPQLRQMAAWAMGQDNDHPDTFHQALRMLVEDPKPMVRWNAALALARYGDSDAGSKLREMLHPYDLTAPTAGTLRIRTPAGSSVRDGTVLARLAGDKSKPLEVRSPLEGRIDRWEVSEGTKLIGGERIAVLSPDETSVWDSLVALYLVGQPQDLEDVDRFARGVPGMPERIRRQAEVTAQAIRQRASQDRS
jgi:hypothetical protein